MANQLQGVNLQPQAQSSAVPMVRPEQITDRSAVGDFLSGLGSLNPEITQAIGTYQKQQQDPRKLRDEKARLEFQMQGMNSDQMSKMDLSQYSPSAQQAAGYRQGQQAALEAATSINQQAQQMNAADIDPDSLISSARDKFAQQFGDNASAMRGFNEAMAQVPGQLAQYKLRGTQADYVSKRDDAVSAVFNNAYDTGGMAAVQKVMKENADYLKMPAANQSQVIQNLIKSAAINGQPDKVNDLGGMDMGQGKLSDVMGPQFQTLAKQAQTVSDQQLKEDFQPRMYDWLQKASDGEYDANTKAEAEAYSKAHPKILPASTLEALDRSNTAALHQKNEQLAKQQRENALDIWTSTNLPHITDAVHSGSLKLAVTQDQQLPLADGSQANIEKKKIIDNSLLQVGTADQKAATSAALKAGKSQAEADEAGRQARFMTYAKNNEVPEDIKQSALGVLNRANGQADPTPADLRGAQDLVLMKRNSPTLLDSLVTDPRQKAFIDSLDVQMGHMPPDMDQQQALALATKRAIVDRDNYGTYGAMPHDDKAKALKKVVAGLPNADGDGLGNWAKYIASFGMYGNGTPPVNQGQVNALADKYITQLWARGVRGDDLATQASKAIQANTLNYKGNLINVEGLPIHDPKAYGPAFDALTKSLKEQGAFKDLHDDDISWQRVGDTDRFVAVDPRGQLLPTPNINSSQLWLNYGKVHAEETKRKQASDLAAGRDKTIYQDSFAPKVQPLNLGNF